MSPVRSVYVPRFGSQLGSSQRDEPPPPDPQTVHRSAQLEAPPRWGQRDKRGNKRRNLSVGKTRFLLKVKLKKVNSTSSQKTDKTPRKGLAVPAANKPKTTVSRGGAGFECEPVDGDVFFFSERPASTEMNEKEKANLAVLKTISKMLKENQLIRQRLAVISQAT